jgi:hypothetical protein
MQNPFRWPFLQAGSHKPWPQLTSAGAVLPPGKASAAGLAGWVVSRKLCRFRHFAVPAAAGAQRRAVLRNLLLAWAPFDSSQYCTVWRGETAFAWAWDRAAAQSMLAMAGAPGAATLWPEALLLEPPPADALRLVQCLEGVDGQVWHGGELTASRWWPQVPDALEWARWCRSAGKTIDDDAAAPPPVEAPLWRARPWADGLALDALLSSTSRLERVALAAALVTLVGLSAGVARQAWAAYAEQRVLVAERDRVAAVAAPVVAARDQALAMAAQAESLSNQMSALQPLEVLLHLSERLPARGATLKEFELTGSRLRIALEAGPEVARAAVVKDLQATGWFQQVSEVRDSTGRGWLWFEMQVQGLRPPVTIGGAAPPRPAGSAALTLPTGAPQPMPALPGARP